MSVCFVLSVGFKESKTAKQPDKCNHPFHSKIFLFRLLIDFERLNVNCSLFFPFALLLQQNYIFKRVKFVKQSIMSNNYLKWSLFRMKTDINISEIAKEISMNTKHLLFIHWVKMCVILFCHLKKIKMYISNHAIITRFQIYLKFIEDRKSLDSCNWTTIKINK